MSDRYFEIIRIDRYGLSPAGEVLRGWMDSHGVDTARMATAACTSTDVIMRILEGKKVVGNVLACKLSVPTGIPPEVWLNHFQLMGLLTAGDP